MPTLPHPSPLARHWALDPGVVFLNHGSFGACPTRVLTFQSDLRARLEREPVRFFVESHDALLDESRAELARFVRAAADDLVFVTNATTGVATALAALEPRLRPGDELLAPTHEYPACLNNLRRSAARTGAVPVAVPLPFPVAGERAIVEAVMAGVTPRTRVALLSHVAAPTALCLPLRRIVPELESRGIATIVDGAHAPGQVAGLDVPALGASFYTANAHKWLCTPKGSAFLWVRRDLHPVVRPLVLSNHAETTRPGRSRLHTEFDYVGTADPTAWMSVGEGLRTMASLVPGGWDELLVRNHTLACEARTILHAALGTPDECPADMLASMASVVLPPRPPGEARPTRYHDPLQDALLDRWHIQVPVWGVPETTTRILRISAQAYNSREQYVYLAGALSEELARERSAAR